MDINKMVGERIRRARLMAGLVQSQVAEKVGVTTMSISKWERGEVDITVRRLEELSKALDMPLRYFILPTCTCVEVEEKEE